MNFVLGHHQWMKKFESFFLRKKLIFHFNNVNGFGNYYCFSFSFFAHFIFFKIVVERTNTASIKSSSSSSASSTNIMMIDHHTTTSAKQREQTSMNNDDDDQMIRVRVLNSSEVYEGNDAILKCEYNRYNSLYEVAAWFRDDGRIYLPLERLVSSIRRTLSGGLSTSSSSSSSSSLSSNKIHYGKFGMLEILESTLN